MFSLSIGFTIWFCLLSKLTKQLFYLNIWILLCSCVLIITYRMESVCLVPIQEIQNQCIWLWETIVLNILNKFILLFIKDHFPTCNQELILSCSDFLDPLIEYQPVRVWISAKQFKLADTYLLQKSQGIIMQNFSELLEEKKNSTNFWRNYLNNHKILL